MQRQRIRLKQKYYVYTLAYPDGTMFYVGKGSSMSTPRITGHIQEAMSGKRSAKCEVIRQILAQGEEVLFTIIAEYDLESDALAHESRLIKQYGSSVTNASRQGRPLCGLQKSGLSPFGTVLDHLCQTLGVNWQCIADRSDLNKATISLIARGERNPARNTVLDICAAFRQFPEYQPEWEQALLNSAGFATETQAQEAMKLVLSSGKLRAIKHPLPFE